MKLKRSQARQWLPIRSLTDNKSHGGRALIIAGSPEMPGAALLASQAASRMGAGYTYVSCKDVVGYFPEALLWDKKNFNRFNSILIGPGLGVNASTARLINQLKKIKTPVVIDADALTVIAQKKMFSLPADWIATPHSGELSRLINWSLEEIQKNRLKAVYTAQKKLGCIVVLKGFGTVVAHSKGHFIIPTGNVALAKGGSGDVLAGMMAGLLSQGVPSLQAAALACYVHGLIADEWVQKGQDYLTLTASDIILKIPKTLFRLRKVA